MIKFKYKLRQCLGWGAGEWAAAASACTDGRREAHGSADEAAGKLKSERKGSDEVKSELEFEREKIDAIDKETARLFSERMSCAENIARLKSESGLPVFDAKRESELLKRESSFVEPKLEKHYRKLLTCIMSVSKDYQNELIKSEDTVLVSASLGTYEIKIKPSGINEVGKLFDLDRKVLVVTDSGVPAEYAKAVASQCAEATVLTLPQGESAKDIESLTKAERVMLEKGFDRGDCVVAVGGGVVGDLAGFAASTYMRGIDFYNVPTTLLSQVDSSVGGKTAINFGGVKNAIGSFKQPSGVLTDTSLLSSLDKRQISNGLAEVIKMALTSDGELFNIIESESPTDSLDLIVKRSIEIKKSIVEKDERESGLRKMLNFGHTIGHAIESESGLLHGECVALGMLPMVSDEIRQRLIPLYEKLGLPTKYDIGESFKYLVSHDKKSSGETITAVKVNRIGEYEFCPMTAGELERKAREVLSK